MANETEDDFSRPENIVIINCVLNAPLMLICIIGNSLVLAAILRTPSLRSPSTVFLCSLAVSDLLVGLVIQPVYIANELIRNDLLYTMRNIMVFSACGVSLLTLTVISVDRFLALYYHMRYPDLMTTNRAKNISAALWLLTFPFNIFSSWKISSHHFPIVITIISCLSISTACYTGIFRIVRRHQLQIHAQQQAVQILNAENDQSMQRSKKNAINTFIYYIVMILCYIPLFISLSIASISLSKWSKVWILAETVGFMNSFFVLLASLRASSGSCKDNKADVM